MRILVVGTGAIGAYYGGKLSLAGHEVFFVARGETLSAIKSNGVFVESFKGDFTAHPAGASDKFEPLGGLDLILVCVKRGDTAGVLKIISEQAGENTIVLSLQNGLDAEAEIATVINPSNVIGGIAFIGSAVTAPGKIKHTARGVVTIGEADGSNSERALKLKKMFEDADVQCAVSADIVKAKWEKLMWNVGFNGVCALSGNTVHKILDFPPTAELVKKLMEELVGVAEELGVDVDKGLVAKYLENTRKGGDVVPSTLQDMRHGKKTEIEFMNGKVCDEGKKVGYPTPFNDTVRALVSSIDGSRG